MTRLAIRNFFHNLGVPARAVNCLLQGKFRAAGTELCRFGINTTVGVLGRPVTKIIDEPAAAEEPKGAVPEQ